MKKSITCLLVAIVASFLLVGCTETTHKPSQWEYGELSLDQDNWGWESPDGNSICYDTTV